MAKEEKALTIRDEGIQEQVDTFRRDGYNVVVPFSIPADRLNDWQRFRIAVVQVDPNPEAGDVWYVGTSNVNGKWIRKYVLGKPGLMKIRMAAGISWDPDRSGRTDDGKEPDRISYRAVGLYHGPDGCESVLSGEYELDLVVEEEEIRDQQERKVNADGFKLPKKDGHLEGKEPEEIVEYLTRRELLQLRRHKLARAETGAKLRALRELGIKSTYTEDELSRPFVFVRLDYAPDYAKPEVAQVAKARVNREIEDLYGPPQDVQHEEVKEENETPSNATPEVTDQPDPKMLNHLQVGRFWAKFGQLGAKLDTLGVKSDKVEALAAMFGITLDDTEITVSGAKALIEKMQEQVEEEEKRAKERENLPF